MAFQKPSLMRKLMWLVLGLGGSIFLINAVGCIYMQHQLKLNAEDTIRQVLAQHATNVQEMTVSSRFLGVTASATLIIMDLNTSGDHTCATGEIHKGKKFGFLFPFNMGPPQDIQVCVDR